MSLKNLKDVYLHQLQDLYSGCKQSLDVTNELGRAAKDEDLSKALIAGAQGISKGMDQLQSLCAKHDIDPEGAHCKGMEGLVKEARSHGLKEDFGNHDVQDAVIITQYQRMVHYALAGYGSLLAFANRLNLDDDAAVLQGQLDETYDGDRTMTAIATRGGVNEAAA